MRILLSNDDGIHAQGLKAIYKELKKLGQVWVVAPLQERSTTGHSLTLHKPLRILPMGPDFYAVSGSPADCVYLGIREIIGEMPDLVISGVNRGANLGQDVYYSGTVSAAREACILGISSMAISLSVNFRENQIETDFNYASAAKVAVSVLKRLKEMSLPKYTLLNLNVPDLPLNQIKGIRLARQGFRYYSGSILKRRDHHGKPYYWIGGRYKGFLKEKDSDCSAIESAYASLTPLKLDSTDFSYLSFLEQNGVENFKTKKRKK